MENKTTNNPDTFASARQGKDTKNGTEKVASNQAVEEIQEHGIILNSPLGPLFEFSVTRDEILKNCFWVVSFANRKYNDITISHSKFIDFLHWMGLAKVKINGEFRFVVSRRRVFRDINLLELKDLINQFIYNLSKHSDYLPGYESDEVPVALLREKLLRGSNIYFSRAKLENLPTIPYEPLRDTAEIAYLLFQNGFVKVTKDDDPKRIPYSQLEGDIWYEQIITHNIKLIDQQTNTCDFDKFLENISGSPERYQSHRSYIGFILHGFRDPSCPQVLVLYDEKPPGQTQDYESAEGGTGKGIIFTALSTLRKTVIIDGKSFNHNSGFPWQRLDSDTQLVVLNDVKNDFVFSNLHSVVTDGISINRKHRPEIYIPYSQSPKFLVTTNFIIDTSDVSDRRRIKEIKLAPFYNLENTPKDEFERLLFEGWDYTEWNRFYNVMMDYVKDYLESGFSDQSESYTDAEHKFIFTYGQGVLDVLNGLQISTSRDRSSGLRHFTPEIREKCAAMTSKPITEQTFPKALKSYAKLAPDIEPPVDMWSSNSGRLFLLYGRNKREFTENESIKYDLNVGYVP